MTPEERRDLQKRTEKALSNHGFYGRNGVWNSLIKLPGDDRLYRERVETIIVRNRKEVFIKKKPNGEYFLPGGSTEKDIPNINQAINECKEEAHINVRNIESTGITYKEIEKHKKWMIDECEILWDGKYTEVYVAEYDGMYHGHVDKVDEDSFIRSGKWYPTKECFKIFRPEHREALLWYLKQTETSSEDEVTESYITNYFGNRKLLKKINKTPDIDVGVIDKMLSELKKEYGKLASKSSIKREMKKSDVGNIFHPILDFTFPDGESIAIAICFDNKSFTDGAAIRSDNFGDIIVLYPNFFKEKRDDQIFTILHEMGHIRLGHLDRRNIKKNIHGDDTTNDHRVRMMGKGKAIYPELNADLYAILNGASMYAILNSSIKQDYDDELDYRFTNGELANRYKYVWDKYRKWNPNGFAYEASFILDAAKMAVYEMAYNESGDLSESDKYDLYKFIYTFFVEKRVDNISKDEREKLMLEYGNDDIVDAVIFAESVLSRAEAKSPIVQFSLEKELLKNEIYSEMMRLKDKLRLKDVYTEGTGNISTKYITLLESLSSKERKKIPTEKFGIPEERKYPLDTKKHVKSAIRLFGHCEEKYRKELAERIFKAMKKFDISDDIIGPKSKLNEYK